jgi:hypothetical protein
VQRVRGDDLLQLRDDRGAVALGDRGRDPFLPRGEPQLLQTDRGVTCDVRKIQRSVPEGQGVGDGGRVAGEAFEAVRVDRSGSVSRRYPAGAVSMASPARRSREISACSAFAAAAGGSSPHTPSMSRSADTTWSAPRARRVSRLRSRAPATGTVSPVRARSSNGPRTAISTPRFCPARQTKSAPSASRRRRIGRLGMSDRTERSEGMAEGSAA